MQKKGVFLGRFQPIHNGHLKVIKTILEEVDELIILIGSSQYSHSFNNPFTAGERISMIRNALKQKNIDLRRVYIIPIPDTNDNRIWVSHVAATIPQFDLFFTNNPLVSRLMKEAGYKTKNTKMFQRDKLSSTEIRNRIYNHEPWESLVPESVASFIETIDGINRIRDIGKIELKL
ncbi:MAG: nicotinamide-nucleotide adenylyltransferase [Candidatus Lokiarchaeota archaeon]|nr:nicotinamide-nucleotide adenylyltransferase [Candidatus Lokiarchaeota archaeon]